MPRRPSHRSLAAYTQATVSSAAALSAVGTSQAAIVFFDVDPAKTIGVAGDPPNQNLVFKDINLGAGTYYSYITPFNFLPFSTMFWFNISGPDEFTAAGNYIGLGANNESKSLYKFSYGALVSLFPTVSSAYVLNEGQWNGGGTGYVSLLLQDGPDAYWGWAELQFVEAGGATTLSVTGFAFENTPNAPILAGDTGGGPAPVPEPGTMAVGAGLFALAVGVHLRRRREKKAAASDALLNLAAGARGVEKFRADKAA